MIPVRQLDPRTSVIYLEAPKTQILLLQVIFELYDGLGAVRTIRGTDGLVGLMTTTEQVPDCLEVLEGIRDLVRWRAVESDLHPLQ